ncbi:MAG: hypothetical protein ACI4FN_03960 [Acutalibacteraceae bacterium]
MDNELIEKYKKEFLRMYGSSSTSRVKPVSAEVEPPKVQEPRPEEQTPLYRQGEYEEGTPYDKEDSTDPNGRLIVMVTAFSRLYPVENAKVTVFTGDYTAPNVTDTALTDQSGKTKAFSLPAPSRELSMEPDAGAQPYSLYNVLIEADGYADNLHINLPIFRGVTSLQRSNLTPLASFGGNKGPIVFNELSSFNL